MAYPYRGVSGLAIGMLVAGGVLVYSSLKNATVADTLRALIQGKPVIGSDVGSLGRSLQAASAEVGAVVGASSTAPTNSADAIVTAAKKYLGAPYVFGAAGPTTFDCSGFVNWVLGHDLHLPIPGSATGTYSGHGPTTYDYYGWSGAVTVPNSQQQAGDLVCWTGHIGIAVDSQNFINAPHTGAVVRIDKVWGPPAPLIRRLVQVATPGSGDQNQKAPSGSTPGFV